MARIGIVGGGIVGSAIAVWLIGDGHEVTLFEREPDGLPASTGNAGLLALPEIEPLARPGILFSVPRWLVDPLGPLALRWRDAPALAPWLARFVAASTPRQVARSTAALAGLMATALADHDELARRAGLSGHMRKTGALTVFDRPAGVAAAAARADEARRRLGFEAEALDAPAARRLAPALEGPFAGAVLARDYWTVTHPRAVLRALHARIRAAGAIVPMAVRAVARRPERVEIVGPDGAAHGFDRAVVAAGIWSRALVRTLGLRVLLETERGYNTTFDDPPFELGLPVFFGDHGFVATPLEGALRVGGAVEMAAPDAPPDFRRAAAMRDRMRRYVPALPREGGVEWMGRRPSTPDSLPVIARHPADPRVLFAFGHGHLGLTLSAVTARHIATLAAGGPADPLRPFDIARFR